MEGAGLRSDFAGFSDYSQFAEIIAWGIDSESPISYDAASETQFQQLPAMPDLLPLQLLPSGQRARIDQLLGRADEVHRLQELGMRVGTPIEMLQSGSTCIVKLDGTRLAFRDHEGFRVLVRAGRSRVSTLAELAVGSRAKVARIDGVG